MVERFGEIDVLVNNAGVAPKIRLDMLETTEESFDFVVGTVLKGTMFMTQLVANQMLKHCLLYTSGNADASSGWRVVLPAIFWKDNEHPSAPCICGDGKHPKSAADSGSVEHGGTIWAVIS